MIFPYVVDSARRRVRVTLSGTVHGHYIAETIEAIYRDPQWQAGFDTLWDGTGTTELLLERHDQPRQLELNQKYAAISGRGRDVLLVRRPIDISMAKMYAARAKGGPREVFVATNEAEALRILDRTGEKQAAQ